jgi:polysaccharide biosynthesis protein PelF
MKPHIMLTTEGTYPYMGGGVSTWCHELTQQLGDVDFTLFAIVANPYINQHYDLTKNVRQVMKVPLWGMEDPIEYGWRFPFSRALKSKIATNTQAISAQFIPLLDRFLNDILYPYNSDIDELGNTLVAIHDYFLRYDYHVTMRSIEVWQCFRQISSGAWQHSSRPEEITIGEITEALRLFSRLFAPIHVPIPAVDLVHASSASYCGLPGIIAKLKHGIPFLLTEHGINIREQYLNLRSSIPSMFVRRFLHHLVSAVVKLNYHFADLVAPVCAYNTRWEQWWDVPKEKIRVIYNGADPEKFRPDPQQENTRPLVVTMGLIFALKGQLDLIEAANIIRDRIPDIEFRIYGKPSDMEYFARCQAKVAEYQLESTVNFAGFTSEPWQAYSQADVVAMPSISEGFPYAIIEAMLSGATIVSSDVGGVSEALGDTGLLVPASSPRALADSILQLFDLLPEQRRELGRQARERALELFTQKQCMDNHLDTYLELIRKSKISSWKADLSGLGSSFALNG